MRADKAVRIASVACALIIGVSLITVAVLFNDINRLFYDVLHDIQEFKVLANDAWREIMSVNAMTKAHSYPSSNRNTFKDIVKREGQGVLTKRYQTHVICACAPQPTYCKAGPIGPPGDAGIPGENGAPGLNGRHGIDGVNIVYNMQKETGCIKCPIGPPGPRGRRGRVGAVGPRGKMGNAGRVGRPGSRGPAGPPGMRGVIGRRGEPGPRGPPGRNGLTGKPQRGSKGRPGIKGLPGKRGPPGRPGMRGYPGPMGARGAPGYPGLPGVRGQQGPPGTFGLHGIDARYCPCPPRSEIDLQRYRPAQQRRKAIAMKIYRNSLKGGGTKIPNVVRRNQPNKKHGVLKFLKKYRGKTKIHKKIITNEQTSNSLYH